MTDAAVATEVRPSIRSSLIARLAAGLAAVIAVVALVLVLSGIGGEAPPATGADTLVPADALGYLNVSIDSSRPAIKRAAKLAKRLPTLGLLSGAVQTRLSGSAGAAGSINFSSDVRPW